ncbi:hypothetical protein BJ912DRAFT_1023226 [Pholiota molesta]|nr:hypothetical protein BJ912DRAFT_1023226 [Pholiota molesta]
MHSPFDSCSLPDNQAFEVKGLPAHKISPPPPPSVISSGAATNTSTPSAPLPVSPPKPSGSTNNTTTTTNSTVTAGPATSNPVALCEVCQLRPKHFDGTKTHPYCSKTCANKKANSNTLNRARDLGTPPIFCHNRPKYSDGTKTHDYCSKACARSAHGPQRRLTSAGPPAHEPPHVGGHEYCSVAHKTLGETLCLMCMQAPKMANSHFCNQTCIDDAESKGPMILEVPQDIDQFKASWRHVGTVCPPVRRVYKIQIPAVSLAAYNTYKDGVEARGQFASSGRSEGNENRRDKGHTQFCTATTKTGWGRYVVRKRIYTSSTSSKSNDYSHNDCKSNLKAILLNKVVVGKGCKLLQDNTSLTAPPAGFDSVLAEKGGSLNYDELVVYSNDAIRPSFLVMYEP